MNELTIVLRARDLATRVIRGVGRSIQVFGRGAARVFAGVRRSIFSLQTALGAGLGIGIVNTFRQFERGIVNIQTLTDDASASFQRLGDEVIRVGLETGQSLDTLTGAGFNAVSAAGVEGFSLLDQAARLAVAGVTDVNTAVQGITSVLNNYNLGVERAAFVSDLLFNIQRVGVTNVQQVAENFQTVLPAARTFRVELEDLAGAYSALTKSFRAPEAATALRNLVLALGRPQEPARRLAQTLGIEIGAAALRGEGALTRIIRRINDLNLTTDQISTLVGGSVEAFGAISPLINNLDNLEQAITAVREGAGATDRAFEQQAETLDVNLQRLRTAFQVAAVEIGEGLRPVIDDVIDRLQRFIGFIRRNRDVVARFGELILTTLGVAFEEGGKKVLEFIDVVIAAFRENRTFSVITNFAQTIVSILARVLTAGVPTLVRVAIQIGRGFGSALAESILGTTQEQIVRSLSDSRLLTGFLDFIGLEGVGELRERFALFNSEVGDQLQETRRLLTEGFEGTNNIPRNSSGPISRDFFLESQAATLDRLATQIRGFVQEVRAVDREAGISLSNFTNDLVEFSNRSQTIADALKTQGLNPEAIKSVAADLARDIQASFQANESVLATAAGAIFGTTGGDQIFQQVQADASRRLGEEVSKFGARVPNILREELDAAIGRADPAISGPLSRLFDFSGVSSGLEKIREAATRFSSAFVGAREREQIRSFFLELKEQVVSTFPGIERLSELASDSAEKIRTFFRTLTSSSGAEEENPKTVVENTTAAIFTLQDATQAVGPNVSQGLSNLFASIIEGSAKAKGAILDFVSQALSSLSRLFLNAAFQSLLGGVFGGLFPQAAAGGAVVPAATEASNGAIFPGGFRAFANGAPRIAQTTLGVVGEGRFPEAIVPLPDGRRIPVQMMGGGGGGANVMLTFNIQSLDGKDSARVIAEQEGLISGMIARAIRTQPNFRRAIRG